MEPNKNYLLAKASSLARRFLVHLLGYRRFHFAEPPLGIIKVFTKDKLSGQKLTIRLRGSDYFGEEGITCQPSRKSRAQSS